MSITPIYKPDKKENAPDIRAFMKRLTELYRRSAIQASREQHLLICGISGLPVSGLQSSDSVLRR